MLASIRFRARRFCAILLSALAVVAAGAYDPPAGAFHLPSLFSPWGLATAPTVTGGGAPWASRMNPSAGGANQLAIAELAYTGISDFGAGAQGWGSAVGIGFSLPKPYGVIGGSARFFSQAPGMTEMPLGTFGEVKANFAKDLYRDLYAGAAVGIAMGGNGGFGWGLGLDLGITHFPGDLGPLKDFRWGVALTDIGKSYSTPQPAAGSFGTSPSSGYPSGFTLGAGGRGYLVRDYNWNLDVAADLRVPAFQDLSLGFSSGLSFRDLGTLRAGWTLGLRDLIAGTGRSLIPSIGISGNIPLDGGIRLFGTDYRDARVSVAGAVAPLQKSLVGAGLGASLEFGLKDRSAPVVTATLPVPTRGTYFMSPNGDGVKDSLEIPIKITDERYIAGWKFWVEDRSAGKIIRTIGESWEKPARFAGFDGLYDAAKFTYRSVDVPESVVWDGRDDSGNLARDGSYLVSFRAWDDNGNENIELINCLVVVVDTVKPAAGLLAPGGSMILSPDGDGSKDNLGLRLSGSTEKLWTLRVQDEQGKSVRTVQFRDSAPPDFIWDGTADSGARVADGRYSMTLSTSDDSGNEAIRTLRGLVVDTRRPAISLTLDSYAMSPNRDGVKDSIAIGTNLESADSLETWRLFVMDDRRREVWVASGSGGTKPPERYDFGAIIDGAALPDGKYEAGLAVTYSNGYEPMLISEPFLIDSTPPQATLALADAAAVFSPDGDGRRDMAAFTITGTAEELWMLEIRNARNETVRIVEFSGEPPAEFPWNGLDASGRTVPDGMYSAFMWAMDKAGNSGNARSPLLRVDNRRPAVRLSIDRGAFSPNNDGSADSVAIGASVEARDALASWRLRIEQAIVYGAVATNGSTTATPFWELSGTGAASLKSQYVFDGKDARGVLLPEGDYRARIWLDYVNGFQVEAQTAPFTLDVTAPRGSVRADREAFNPAGAATQSRVRFLQTGDAGAAWNGELRDRAGTVVRRWDFGETPPEELAWDGSAESGSTLADGQYAYTLIAKDRAGNSYRSGPVAVILETERKAVRLDADTRAFSPNADGVRDSLSLVPSVQYPERVREWELSVYAQEGAEAMMPVRTWKGSGAVPQKFTWDGVSDRLTQVPDGRYAASLAVTYANADRVQAATPAFLLDTVAPRIEAGASLSLFSPNGDGRSDTVRITQKTPLGDDWSGRIVAADGRVVRTYAWRAQAESFDWNGRDDAGNLVPDGMYWYEVSSTDLAGNRAVGTPRIALEVETARRAVSLQGDLAGFSPNGDGVQDQVSYNVRATAPERIARFDLAIRQAGQAGAQTRAPIRSWSGSGDPGLRFLWDGTTDNGLKAPDGLYEAELQVRYLNDDQVSVKSAPVRLDTVAPKATVRIDSPLFSPNGDGNRDTLRISQESVPGDDWSARIVSASGATLRSWSWKDVIRSTDWNGRDDAGQIARDGTYSYEISAKDIAGNRTIITVPGIRLDASKPKVYVTASDTGMSPNSDGIRDEVSFTLVTEGREGVESWRFSLLDPQGTERSYFGGAGADVPARLVWDGRDLQGQVVQGEFVGKLEVRYLKGDVAQATSQKILVKVDPPKVDLTVTPEYFSPDGDGVDDVLTFGISVDNPAAVVDWKMEILEQAVIESSAPGATGAERLFREWSGRGAPPNRITWDGTSSRRELVESATDYPFRFTARDALGNRTTVSGLIAVDVLVMRDGDRLKIKVPSIVFRANYADFVGLPRDVVARNERVVYRIAEILNKFPEYRIRIEGHANNIGKMLGYSDTRIQAEETKELIPLSIGRAELVSSMLVRYGVDTRRLSIEGLGSSEPVVSFLDVENRWKNRRVEFILIKNQ